MSQMDTDPAATQTFTARSVREAYAQVRQALGPDAVIMEQHSAAGRVTVVASRELPTAAAPDPGPAAEDILLRRLADAGFSPAYLERLGAQIGSWRELKRRVVASVAMETPPRRLEGAYRFVGAPGVGKTTAIVKLAAEHVLNFGAAGCALLSTDQRRLAGSEQLSVAAELLGVRFLETDPAGLDEALLTLKDHSLVLVDSAGVSGGQLPLAPASCADLFVMPAPWQASALRRSLTLVPQQRLAGVVLTQVDQCDSLGAAMSVLNELAVPLRWISRSGDLYEDLEAVSDKLLAEIVFPDVDRSGMSTTFA